MNKNNNNRKKEREIKIKHYIYLNICYMLFHSNTYIIYMFYLFCSCILYTYV